MIRRALRVAVLGSGLALLVGGALSGLFGGAVSGGGAPIWLTVLLGLVVVVLSLAKLLRAPGSDGVAAAPWSEGGAIVDERPEETPDTDPLSGTELAETIDDAVADARSAETVEAGVAVVREPLRGALVATLRQGGWDRERIEAALSSGSWTDDPVAAAVLDEDVLPPDRALRRRLWAWLFPEKAVRRRTARAVGAVASTADAVLSPVVGQNAPRPVPVVEPTLEDLQRASDESLRRAVEGTAAVGARRYDRSGPESGSRDGETSPGDRAASAEDGTADGGEGDESLDPDWPGAAGGGD